jgi:hypothetical protein
MPPTNPPERERQSGTPSQSLFAKAVAAAGPRQTGNSIHEKNNSINNTLQQTRAAQDTKVLAPLMLAAVSRLGIEPRTYGLKVRCSTN